MKMDLENMKSGLKMKMRPENKKDRRVIKEMLSVVGDYYYAPPSRVITFLSHWPNPDKGQIQEANFIIAQNPYAKE